MAGIRAIQRMHWRQTNQTVCSCRTSYIFISYSYFISQSTAILQYCIDHNGNYYIGEHKEDKFNGEGIYYMKFGIE